MWRIILIRGTESTVTKYLCRRRMCECVYMIFSCQRVRVMIWDYSIQITRNYVNPSAHGVDVDDGVWEPVLSCTSSSYILYEPRTVMISLHIRTACFLDVNELRCNVIFNIYYSIVDTQTMMMMHMRPGQGYRTDAYFFFFSSTALRWHLYSPMKRQSALMITVSLTPWNFYHVTFNLRKKNKYIYIYHNNKHNIQTTQIDLIDRYCAGKTNSVLSFLQHDTRTYNYRTGSKVKSIREYWTKLLFR